MRRRSPTSGSASTSSSGCEIGRSVSTPAVPSVSRQISPPRMKPPKENASSISSGDAGEDSWSSIERWNFCCSSEDELLEKAFIAQAIITSPGMMKVT